MKTIFPWKLLIKCSNEQEADNEITLSKRDPSAKRDRQREIDEKRGGLQRALYQQLQCSPQGSYIASTPGGSSSLHTK